MCMLMAFIAVLFIKAAKGSVCTMCDFWSIDFGNSHVKATMAQDVMKYLCYDNKDTHVANVKKTDNLAAVSIIEQQFV